MTDSPKRVRLAVTYVPGLGCEIDQVVSDLVSLTGRKLKKGDVRDLFILGALAKQAGFTTVRDLGGHHTLITIGAGSASVPTPQVPSAVVATQVGARMMSADSTPTVESVPTHVAANDGIADAGRAGVKANSQADPSASKGVGSVATAPGKEASQTAGTQQGTEQTSKDRTKPVTVSPRANASSATATSGKSGNATATNEPTQKRDVSVKSPAVTENVTVSALTDTAEESAEGADKTVMTVAEGEALLAQAFSFT